MKHWIKKFNPKTVYLFLAGCLTLGLVIGLSMPVRAGEPLPSILIIDSYHQGESWSDNEIAGIFSELQSQYPDLMPSIEHLDAKRFPEPEHLEKMAQYLKEKYDDRQLDILMVLDNPAFEMILTYREGLFPGVPVVFAGINGYQPEMLNGQEMITGVAETQDFTGTIDLALTLNPEVKHIFAVHDYTASGLAVRQEMEALIPVLKSRVDVTFSPEIPFDELQLILQRLPSNAVVLIMTYVTDASGQTFTRAESTRLISESSPVPVYAMHETRLGYGILGGRLLHGEDHGRQAARLALRVLDGESPEAIPVENSLSDSILDYQQLERFQLAGARIPDGVIVINQPVSWWEKNQDLLIPALGVIAGLSLLSAILTIFILSIRRAERRLRQREHDFSSLVENAADMIVRFDTRLRHVYVNPAVERQLGVSPAAIIGKTPTEIGGPPEQVHFIEQSLHRVLETGSPLEVEQNYSTPDGVGYFQTRIVPETGPNGQIETVLAISRDITDRRRNEQSLRESEEKYRILFENAVEAIFVAQDGKLRFINPNTERLIGYPENILLSEPFTEFIYPEDRGLVYQRHIQRMKGISTPDVYSFRIIQRSGNIRWVELNTVMIEWEGKPGTLNFLTDITDRKQADDILRESEEKFALAFRASPYAITITRASDGRMIDVNDGFTKITGYAYEDVIGRTTLALNLWVEDADRREVVAELQKNRWVNDVEYRFRSKSGRIIPGLFSAGMIKIGNEPCILSTINDITEWKKHEQALRESETRYRTVVSSATEGIILLDQAGRIQAWNHAAERTFGFRA